MYYFCYTNLAKEYYRLQFLVEEKNELLHREEQISIQAGELVGKLYDAILKQYVDPTDPKTLHSLNILCVRIVFCLYAEDSGIFGEHLKFHNYIKSFAPKDVRRALIELFRVLDTKTEERDPYMDEVLASFPYVNGGLFADEDIEVLMAKIIKAINDKSPIDVDKSLKLIAASMTSYYDYKEDEEKMPITLKELRSESTPREISTAIGFIIAMRQQFYYIPEDEQKAMDNKQDEGSDSDEKPKNA